MKKSLTVVVFALCGLLGLTGCTKTADPSKTDFASISGEAVETGEAQLIALSGYNNLDNVNSATITENITSDNTALYKNGLSDQSSAQSSSTNGSIIFYSNYLMSGKADVNTSATFATGATITQHHKEIDYAWAAPSDDPALPNTDSFYEEEKVLNIDGSIISDNFSVVASSFAPTSAVEAPWNALIQNMLFAIGSTVVENLQVSYFVKISNDLFASSMQETSISSLQNPLFPNDSTKSIASRTLTERDAFYSRIGEGVFHISEEKYITKTLVSNDFSNNVLPEPIALNSTIIDMKVSYGDKSAGTIPAYQKSASIVSPVLVTFENFYPKPTVSSTQTLSNVTSSYKILHPSFSGYAFLSSAKLNRSYFYSFSTSTDVSGANPNYSRWGYSSISGTAKDLGLIVTIDSSQGTNLFSATNGTYSFLMLFNANQEFLSVQIDCVE